MLRKEKNIIVFDNKSKYEQINKISQKVGETF